MFFFSLSTMFYNENCVLLRCKLTLCLLRGKYVCFTVDYRFFMKNMFLQRDILFFFEKYICFTMITVFLLRRELTLCLLQRNYRFLRGTMFFFYEKHVFTKKTILLRRKLRCR